MYDRFAGSRWASTEIFCITCASRRPPSAGVDDTMIISIPGVRPRLWGGEGVSSGRHGGEGAVAVGHAEGSLSGARAIEIVTASPVLVLVLDCEGRIDYVNPFFESVTSHALRELRGSDWRLFARNCG